LNLLNLLKVIISVAPVHKGSNQGEERGLEKANMKSRNRWKWEARYWLAHPQSLLGKAEKGEDGFFLLLESDDGVTKFKRGCHQEEFRFDSICRCAIAHLEGHWGYVWG